jgi:hypothetical protein
VAQGVGPEFKPQCCKTNKIREPETAAFIPTWKRWAGVSILVVRNC